MAHSEDFWELRDMLQRDSNGDPDWESAQKMMRREFGVGNLRAMTADQKFKLKQTLSAQNRDP